MPGNGERKPSTMSVGVWISLSALLISLLGGSVVILGQFFAPKTVETKLAVIEEKQKTLDWKVETVRVAQANTSDQVQNINLNMVKLMERFKLDVVPVPPPKPLPSKPDDLIEP